MWVHWAQIGKLWLRGLRQLQKNNSVKAYDKTQNASDCGSELCVSKAKM